MSFGSAPREARLLLVGNIPVDLTVHVSGLPAPGADVRGDSARVAAGGGFTVLHAAQRAGLRGRFAGGHGTGPFGELVRAALVGLGCDVLQPRGSDRDSGWVVVLVDGRGERTFVSSPDAVVPFDDETLTDLQVGPTDLVYVSGYSLGLGALSLPLARWVSGLRPGCPLFCDLGPWGARAPAEVMTAVIGRLDWLSCNAQEASLVTGEADPAAAAAALQRRSGHAVVLVRAGEHGCWAASPDGDLELIPAPAVPDVLDTNGAGDTHSGAFLAAVADGKTLRDAVVLANAAAARAVAVPRGASWDESSPWDASRRRRAESSA